MSPLLQLSATELARRIRERECSSVEVVEAHIQQLLAVNPRINAVVAERLEAAREEAEAADQQAERTPGFLPPLLGVPCTIKECFAVQGMPQCAGLVARKDYRAEVDATTVARLRAAGAIVLGVSNTSELCMWMETNNRVYGRTNSPYDSGRIVGGSSGGEGAIVACGASPFGLGSDVGGSIRMPAFFNGVFGHKPTGGLVPSTGQFPIVDPAAGRILSTGPLCRRAEDLMPLVELLAGPDGQDPSCAEMPLGNPSTVDVARLKVINVRSDGRNRVHGSLQKAQTDCLDHLDNLGCNIKEGHFTGLSSSFDIWSSMFGAAESRGKFRQMLGDKRPLDLLGHLVLWALRLSPHTLPALGLGLLEDIGHWMPRRSARMIAHGQRLKSELIEAIGDGVLLYPSYPSPAPRHGHPLFPPLQWVYTAILNVMELPVTQVPLGLDAKGRPVGIQVVAGPGRDHVSIAVALELERAFGGWVPPKQ